MKLYKIKTPRIITRFFSKYTWQFSSQKKEIYLTFDDGPTHEITDFVLTELKKHNAKATFFCIGKNVVNHPKIYARILTEGHTVGNHTHNHFNGWKHALEDYISNIEKATQHIKSKLFRPPYGKITSRQANYLLKKEYKIIMWSVLSADFDTSISKEKCLKNVLENTTKGSIVVFHDSVKASEKLRFVLPKVLTEFSKQGFIFKAIQ